MWTTLFGMAVMAVDFGYLYTKKRGLQSIADSALKAAMPQFKNGGANAAENRARQVTTANVYTPSEVTVVTGLPANRFGITVSRSHPTFFGSLFGLPSKTLSATAIGELTAASGGPAIWAGDATACGPQWDQTTGIDIRGNGFLNVNGDVQTRNKVHFGSPNGLCNNPTVCLISGTVTTGAGCMFWNDTPAPPGNVSVSGGSTTGAPADPINVAQATMALGCTIGNFGAAMAGLPWLPEAGGCNSLAATGVYCSATPILIAPPGPAGSMCPTVSSFFSLQNIQIQVNGDVDLTPHGNAPQGIIFYTPAPMNVGVPAIQLTAGALGTVQLRGKVYAPFGRIDFQTNTTNMMVGNTLAGSVVSISLGNGASWQFNGGGGGGGGTGWRVYR